MIQANILQEFHPFGQAEHIRDLHDQQTYSRIVLSLREQKENKFNYLNLPNYSPTGQKNL